MVRRSSDGWWQVTLGCETWFLTKEERDRVITLQKKVGLPVEIPDYIDREALVKKLYTDEKYGMANSFCLPKRASARSATFGEDVYARPVAEEEIRRNSYEYVKMRDRIE